MADYVSPSYVLWFQRTGRGWGLMAGRGWTAHWMCEWLTKMVEVNIKYINCVLHVGFPSGGFCRFVHVSPGVADEFNTHADEIMVDCFPIEKKDGASRPD